MGAISLPYRVRGIRYGCQYSAASGESPKSRAHHGKGRVHGKVLQDLIGHDEIEMDVFRNIVKRAKIEGSIGIGVHGKIRAGNAGHRILKRFVGASAHIQNTHVWLQQSSKLILDGADRQVVYGAESPVTFAPKLHEAGPG